MAGVVGAEVNEAALDLLVPHLKQVSPASGGPFGVARAPRPVLVRAVAAAFDDQQVRAGHDAVEIPGVVDNRGERAADFLDPGGDLLLAVGDAPLGEVPTALSSNRSRMFPPLEVPPPWSKADRYSRVTDSRRSSVMRRGPR